AVDQHRAALIGSVGDRQIADDELLSSAEINGKRSWSTTGVDDGRWSSTPRNNEIVRDQEIRWVRRGVQHIRPRRKLQRIAAGECIGLLNRGSQRADAATRSDLANAVTRLGVGSVVRRVDEQDGGFSRRSQVSKDMRQH